MNPVSLLSDTGPPACGFVDNSPLCFELPTSPTGATAAAAAVLFLFCCQDAGGQLFDGQMVNFSTATLFLYWSKWSTFRRPCGQLFICQIHTGSRKESGLVDGYIDRPDEFDEVFQQTVQWAYDNRTGVQAALEQVFGKLDLILDLPHNTYEYEADGSVVIRKGSVKVLPGELNIIPSNLGGDISLVRATEKVGGILNSLSHGTGRIVPRGECKALAENYDFLSLRQRVMMPDCIQDASLRTEGPYAYRDLDQCLELLRGYIEEVERFSVIAYMGHL